MRLGFWALVVGVAVLATPALAATNCTPMDAFLNCKDGLMFNIWRPFLHLSVGDKAGRALVYGLCIVYIFLGISIVADRFMSSIEVITSKERQVGFLLWSIHGGVAQWQCSELKSWGFWNPEVDGWELRLSLV